MLVETVCLNVEALGIVDYVRDGSTLRVELLVAAPKAPAAVSGRSF